MSNEIETPRTPLRKKIFVALGVIAALLVLCALLIAMQPAEYHVERSATIPGSPPEVFHVVNDLHHWQEWSPWAKLDPAAKNTYEGAEEGQGAVFMWSGNSEVGEGRMTIVDSQPNEKIRIRLEFIRPYTDAADTDFAFQPEGDQTRVTWSMDGKKDFMTKAVGLFMNMDKMIGESFDEGLANLKSVVEKEKHE